MVPIGRNSYGRITQKLPEFYINHLDEKLTDHLGENIIITLYCVRETELAVGTWSTKLIKKKLMHK